MKLTGLSFASAYYINDLTLSLILVNSGLKNETISYGGKSIELAPLYFTCKETS
jgi:hypothetical protein